MEFAGPNHGRDGFLMPTSDSGARSVVEILGPAGVVAKCLTRDSHRLDGSLTGKRSRPIRTCR